MFKISFQIHNNNQIKYLQKIKDKTHIQKDSEQLFINNKISNLLQETMNYKRTYKNNNLN